MSATSVTLVHEYCYDDVCGNSDQCTYHEGYNAAVEKGQHALTAAVAAERKRLASWSDAQRQAVRAVIAAELKREYPDVAVGYRTVTAMNIGDAVEEYLAAAIRRGDAT